MSHAHILNQDNVPLRPKRREAHRARLRFTDFIPFFFILSLLVPFRIEVGSLLLSPNRIFLLLLLVPCMLTLISGRAGRLRIVDILILAHTTWMSLALLLAHGIGEGAEAAGIHVVEVMGSYLVARCFIRSAETFRSVVGLLFISIVIMLPFLIAETLTGRHFLNAFISLFGPAIDPHSMESRLGLERAFGVFDHPIHLGVYCVSVFSLTFYALGYRSRVFVKYLRAGLVALGGACSMSAGPMLALAFQSMFMGWDLVTRRIRYRWHILGGLAAAMYALVDLISNRTPFHVVVSYLTFNPEGAYTRILIWYFGTAEVYRHPLFGIGLNEWNRPSWMSTSMDNFWLVLAVQGGLPAFLFFAGAVIALCIAVARLQLVDARLIAYRRGWVIAILGLAIAGGTVHYWKTIFCLLVFLIGSAVWMLDEGRRRHAQERTTPAPERKPPRRSIRFG